MGPISPPASSQHPWRVHVVTHLLQVRMQTSRGADDLCQGHSHGIHGMGAQVLDMIRGPGKRHRAEGIQIPTLPFTACWVTLGTDFKLGFLVCKMGTIVTIPETPEISYETPTESEEISYEAPEDPSEAPTTPVIIIDDDSPLAQDVAQVLGARRTGGPAVLGARRGRTGDSATDPLVATLIILGTSATALGMLGSSKKKEN